MENNEDLLFDPVALANWDGVSEFDNSPNKIVEKDKKDEETKVEEEEKLFDEEYLANYEEEEVEVEKVGEPVKKSEKPKGDYKIDLVKSLFKDFVKEGIIEAEDGDLETVNSYEDLSKLVAKTIKSNEFKDLTDEQKFYLKAVREGVPVEEVTAIKADINYIEELKNEDLRDKNEALKIMYFDFVNQGLTEEKAKSLADIAINSPQYYEMALKAKVSLKTALEQSLENKFKEKENERIAKENRIQEEIKAIEAKIKDTNEFFDGVKVNAQTKEKVLKSLFQPVAKNGDALLNEVMEKYKSDSDYKMKLHMLHVLTDGFTNFSKLQQKLETKVNREFDKKLEEVRMKSGSTSSGSRYDAPTSSTVERLKKLNF